MDYALQLLLPVIGGLMLGMWLTKTYGINPIWTVILAVLGMIGGIGVLYRRYASAVPVDPKTIKLHSAQRRAARMNQHNDGKTAHLKELDFLYQEHHPDQDDWKVLDELDSDEEFSQKNTPKTPGQDDSQHHDL
jgi:hypothetical protein